MNIATIAATRCCTGCSRRCHTYPDGRKGCLHCGWAEPTARKLAAQARAARQTANED